MAGGPQLTTTTNDETNGDRLNSWGSRVDAKLAALESAVSMLTTEVQDLRAQITSTQSALLATVEQAKAALDGMADGHRQNLGTLVGDAQAKFMQLELDMTRVTMATDTKLRMLEAALQQASSQAQAPPAHAGAPQGASSAAAERAATLHRPALTGAPLGAVPVAAEGPGYPGAPQGATSGPGSTGAQQRPSADPWASADPWSTRYSGGAAGTAGPQPYQLPPNLTPPGLSSPPPEISG